MILQPTRPWFYIGMIEKSTTVLKIYTLVMPKLMPEIVNEIECLETSKKVLEIRSLPQIEKVCILTSHDTKYSKNYF